MLTIGEALMWDSAGASSKSKASASAAVDEGPAGQAKRALMEFGGDEHGLTVKPDQGLLTGADTVFPVVIDPTMVGTSTRSGWTAAWELYPSTSFWKTSHSLGVGYEGFEQHKIVRSYFQFGVAAFTSKKILAASLRTYEVHSASCSARGVILSRTAAIGTATTWNKQPTRQADVASFSGAKGYNSSCPAGYVEFNVTNSIQYTSTANGATATFGLRASSETDEIGWKQFDSTGLLTIEYIAYPLPAYELGVAAPTDFPGGCAPSTNPTIVASLRPQVSAKGRVAAGDTSARVFVQFLIVNQSQQTVTLNSPTVSPGVLVKMAPTTNLDQNRLYTYHARTVYNYPGDQLISNWSPSCYFKIDTTAPPPPTITASYNGQTLTDCLTTPTPNVCPEAVPFGAKVTYTISSTSTDVVALSYGFNGQMTKVNGRSVTVSLLTPGQTLMTLEAHSHDAAAIPSPPKYHRTNVGPGLPPAAAWSFDDGTGATAADSSGNDHPLTLTTTDFDDAGRVGGSIVFNGGNAGTDRATTPGPVVDTSANFSISAWVRPTALTDSGVVALTGKNANGGQLRYAAAANRWTFVQNVTDTTASPQARLDSLQPPILNAWSHLLAVFNAGDKTMSLYVNGVLQHTITFTHTPWKATGTTEVGSYRVGTGIGVFSGSIDDVKIYPRVLSATEANKVADPRTGPSGADEPVAGLSAHYPFDTVATGTDSVLRTPDAVYGADMTASGFGADPVIVEDPERGTVLNLTGSGSEAVSLNRPVVDASGSFTVTAWVKLSDTSKPRVIVRQAGTTKDSWRLEYRPTTGEDAVWAFSRTTSDSTAGIVTEVTQPTSTFTADDWTALAASYDAANDKLVLKIVDRSQENGIASFSTPVISGTTVVTGPPTAGASLPFAGNLDDLRIYAGVVPQRQLCIDLGDETSCL